MGSYNSFSLGSYNYFSPSLPVGPPPSPPPPSRSSPPSSPPPRSSPPSSPPPPLEDVTYGITEKVDSSEYESPIFHLRASAFIEIPPHSTRTVNTGVAFKLPPFIIGHVSSPNDPLDELKVWSTMITNRNEGPLMLQFSNISNRVRALLSGDVLAQIAFSTAINVETQRIPECLIPVGDMESLSKALEELNSDSGCSTDSYWGNSSNESASFGPTLPPRKKKDRSLCTRCNPYLNSHTGKMIFRSHGPHSRGCPERRRSSDRTWKPRTPCPKEVRRSQYGFRNNRPEMEPSPSYEKIIPFDQF